MIQKLLLSNSFAETLYDCVSSLPLIDYHNHLSVKDLAENRQFRNISEVWLLNDPYKHRAMRICGVDEQLITGNASDKEKFFSWCSIYPMLIGNPLYDWSAMELWEFFHIDLPINAENAERLWNETNEQLSEKDLYARGIYHHFPIRYAAPCASAADDLAPFASIPSLVPSLRGDDLLSLSPAVINKLASRIGAEITDTDSLFAAICSRLDAFHAAGCRFSDHAIDNGFLYRKDDGNNNRRIQKIILGEQLNPLDREYVASEMLRFLANEYGRRKWNMQLHIGAQRFTSSALRRIAGPAGGFACIGNTVNVQSFIQLLDDIEKNDCGMPHTILYTLNPADNAVFAVLSGSFRGVTQGPAWWWCDHMQGMREMLDIFSTYSVLSTFVGMTTDSRSLFSLLRHDYFRRILCSWIGQKVESGEFPNDIQLLSRLVSGMCFYNADKLIS